jgi:DNA-binding response OmpR family regulator
METTRERTVLVIEDDPIVRDVVVRYLVHDGFRTLEARDARTAQWLFESDDVSMVVLDVMLPGVDGFALCRWVRSRSTVPIIMLTARGEEEDRIVGLELGADDYVAKPFSPRELLARVHAVLRRGEREPRPAAGLRVGALEIDPSTREVLRDRRLVRLTAREFDLLRFLCEHPRQVFTREQLMNAVWDDPWTNDSGTVTVHVRRLREKIEEDASHPRHLETVWGVGYRLVP